MGASGLVAVRGGPSTACEGVGVLRGGHRFYGTPYHVGGSTWLKLETEAVPPPLFSPGGVLRKAAHNDINKMYTECVPTLWSSAPDLGRTEEVWIRNEEQCIAFVRAARKDSWRSGSEAALGSAQGSMSDFVSPKSSTSRHCASSMDTVHDLKVRSRLPAPTTKKAWAGCGSGAWCNFRQYGVSTAPPNGNCGRWRQLGE